MAGRRRDWTDFGWQGMRLRVPDDWNLGRLDGDYRTGYVRLDDAEIVRAEVEWREGRSRDGSRLSLNSLVDRYLENLAKKAQKTGMRFAAKRDSRFVADQRWLEGSEHQLFTWEADFRAYNLARACPGCGRVVLLRVLARLDEDLADLAAEVFSSLEDHPPGDQVFWGVYGMRFSMPAAFTLANSALRSGHLQLTFEEGRQVCQVHRLSLAHLLLRGGKLEDWHPFFFKKQLRDFHVAVSPDRLHGHPGMRLEGKPRSRWRQVMRPLPWLNPRPRQFVESCAWHCETADKICVVDYLYRRPKDKTDLLQRVIDGYLCHQDQSEAEPRGDVGLASGAQ